MAKAKQRVAGRLAGKRVLFQGRFDWGVEDRLRGRAEIQGATFAKVIDAKLDYLVLPDATAGKTARQKAQSLIAKGASIQVLDADDFGKLVEPTSGDLLALIRGGKQNASAFRQALGGYQSCVSGTKDKPKHTFAGENFDGLDLSDFDFDGVAFEDCRFVGATLNRTDFDIARGCDFSKATGEVPTFKDVAGGRFAGATFDSASFEGDFGGADFTGAKISGGEFHPWHMPDQPGGGRRNRKPAVAKPVFRKAVLTKAEFDTITLDEADFGGADLTGCKFEDAELPGANLRGATLKDGTLYACKLPGADLGNADLRGANLAGADLSGSRLAGADLTGCNLRGANLDKADLSKAKGHDPAAARVGGVGPSLRALDAVGKKAKRLSVLFHLGGGDARPGKAGGGGGGGGDHEVGVHGSAGYGYQARVPHSMDLRLWTAGGGKPAFSDAMMRLATALGHRPVRYETVQVSSSKSPKSPKEVRDLALAGIAEAFGQAPPAADALAAAAKAHREHAGKKAAAAKQKADAARKEREQRALAAKAKAVAKLTKAAGRVSDFDSFMKAIVVRTDREKVDKATKMLRASGFQLFNDVADTHLLGVVKSQSDPDLVYACRVDHEGHYSCCTQNLNVCGGLRGSVCKHLLVLIIGLVKAGQLDPTTIDGWVARTHGSKPELDKEVMGDIFIRYKGAEAGEVDWRPTETVPEDYYAL